MIDKLEEIMSDPKKVKKLDRAMELFMELGLMVTSVKPFSQEIDTLIPVDFEDNEKQTN